MPNVLDQIAEMHADGDTIAESTATKYRKRLASLLQSSAKRNVGIWRAAGLTEREISTVTSTLLQSVPTGKRGDAWISMFGRIIVAAKEQAFIEIAARKLLTVAADQSERLRVTARAAARLELEQQAIEGVGRKRFEAARAARGTLV